MLASGSPLGRHTDLGGGAMLPPLAAVPLSALPAEAWIGSAGSDASSSEDGMSDVRSLASSGSWSSSAASGGGEDDSHLEDWTSEDAERARSMFSLL